MSRGESWFCRSAPWRAFAERVVLPWATHGVLLHGSVLEIGAGSGAMAATLARHSPDVRIVATDIDPAMVDVASARLRPFGDRATAQVADASGLPFADASFDAVLSFIMLHHTLAWETVLAEVARVLKPGAVLAGYDLVDTALTRAVHVVDRSPHRLLAPPELRSALDTQAFTDVTLRRSLLGNIVRFTARRG